MPSRALSIESIIGPNKGATDADLAVGRENLRRRRPGRSGTCSARRLHWGMEDNLAYAGCEKQDDEYRPRDESAERPLTSECDFTSSVVRYVQGEQEPQVKDK